MDIPTTPNQNLLNYYLKEGLYQNNVVLINKKKQRRKYIFLRQIRKNPKKVQVHDLETDEVAIYPSIYKAALVLGQNPGVIGMYNGKL